MGCINQDVGAKLGFHNQHSAMDALSVRPLLKWVGGKRQLLPHLRRFYPAVFNRYVEPFLGSGAVFFDLYRAGRLRDRDVVLIVLSLARRGSYVLLSNSTAGEIVGLYDRNDQARRAGLRAHRVGRSTASPRGAVLSTNI